MNYPKSFQELIDCFKLLPGVGTKTAERYAFSLLNLDEEKTQEFSNVIENIKKNITTCPNCGCMSEANKCLICDDESRQNDIICVVESQKNVFIFEKLGVFRCKYHVLGGLISPMDGINPEDLSISKLIERIKNEIISQYNRGGMSSLSWHMDNPVTGKDSWDASDTTVVTSILPGGAYHEKFTGWLDKAAEFINSVVR